MGEKLLDRMRRIIRTRHYSYRTEKSYLGWARRYILFHSKQHPSRLGKEEIEAYLSHLAVDRHVAPSTQNQALNGVLFLYRHVLEMDGSWLNGRPACFAPKAGTGSAGSGRGPGNPGPAAYATRQDCRVAVRRRASDERSAAAASERSRFRPARTRGPLNKPARSAFQSEKPPIERCDASDSSRSYGRVAIVMTIRARCGFSGACHDDRLRDGSLRGLCLV
jgi:hypothetical protein